MSVLPVDFLSYAEIAAQTDPLPEIAVRNVIGRAYYAAYHDSQYWHAALEHSGTCPPGATGTHNKFALTLQNPSMANDREVRLRSTRRGVLLRKFHGDRVRADYLLSETVCAEEAPQAIADAQLILSIK